MRLAHVPPRGRAAKSLRLNSARGQKLRLGDEAVNETTAFLGRLRLPHGGECHDHRLNRILARPNLFSGNS